MSNVFKPFNSPLREVYRTFSCADPGELEELYTREDQKHMHAGTWDYANTDHTYNRITSAIEEVGLDAITDPKEKCWIASLLWLWYHHAIGCALWVHGDKRQAKVYAERALTLQSYSQNHPNKITRLLHLLLTEQEAEAEAWTATVTEEPERSYAAWLMEIYLKGEFAKKLTD